MRVFARICIGLVVFYYDFSVLGLLHEIASREVICVTGENGNGIMLCSPLPRER